MAWIILYIVTWMALIASGIRPHDRFTWALEVFWVIGGLIYLLILRKKGIAITPLLKALIFVHALILIYGGRYTYALTPLGEYMKEWFGFARNHYDRIGHFFQGFVPAILIREVLIRKNIIRGRGWNHFIVFCICVAFSALFELLEFAAAASFGKSAESYLGSQGDQWDAQWDIIFCGIGTIVSLVFLAPIHDRQIEKLA